MYELYANPRSPSSLSFVNHLPHARRVLATLLVGSPRHRALRAAVDNPALAGAFAAHAQAYRAACQSGAGAQPLRVYHAGAMSGLMLGLIAANAYPMTRQDFVRQGLAAVYEAVTGEAYPGDEVEAVVKESPETFCSGQRVILDDGTQKRTAHITAVGDGTLTVQDGANTRLFNFAGSDEAGASVSPSPQ